MAPGDDDRLRPHPVEPPGLVQTMEQGALDGLERDQSRGRHCSGHQDHDRVVGLGGAGIEQRRIAGFQRIAQQLADQPAVQNINDRNGGPQKLARPAPAPIHRGQNQQDDPGRRRQEDQLEELLEGEHSATFILW